MNNSKKYICFYFQVHQPMRLSPFSYFDINKQKEYFNVSNKELIHKVGDKCYLPANRTIMRLLEKFDDFKCSFSISGIALKQFDIYSPKIIKSFQELCSTNNVELLSETYYHSLSSLYSIEEFLNQISMHRKIIWDIFKKKPKVFRNTELIYNNRIAEITRNLGFHAILAEGWDDVLGYKSPNFLYKAKHTNLLKDELETIYKHRFDENIGKDINLLLKNYRLSDDIAFRFSNRSWSGFPLTAEKFAKWVNEAPGNIINLFMDYETFGEHQWKETGIFNFLKKLPEELSKYQISFITPSDICKKFKSVDEVDIPDLLSWADVERDLSAWTENRMQKESIKKCYELEKLLRKLEKRAEFSPNFAEHLDTWRKLQTSDHFYYMSTKYWADGDVHAYFSPYESPYDAYINYMNVLNDFRQKILMY